MRKKIESHVSSASNAVNQIDFKKKELERVRFPELRRFDSPKNRFEAPTKRFDATTSRLEPPAHSGSVESPRKRFESSTLIFDVLIFQILWIT